MLCGKEYPAYYVFGSVSPSWIKEPKYLSSPKDSFPEPRVLENTLWETLITGSARAVLRRREVRADLEPARWGWNPGSGSEWQPGAGRGGIYNLSSLHFFIFSQKGRIHCSEDSR